MRTFILLTVIMVMAAAPAFSQVPGPKLELGLGGGVSMPTGTLGDGMNTGYGFAASLGYKVMPMLVVGGEFAYYGNGAQDELLQGLGTGAEMDMTTMQFAAMAKFMMPLMTVHNMYAKGVGGAYHSSSNFKNIPLIGDGSVSDTNLGVGIGGGLRFNGASKTSFYAEGMFHNIFGEAENIQFFAVGAGVIISLP
jgi:hypothetical protein